MNIAGREIGIGHPVYLIAEAGSNWNGDLMTAVDLFYAAMQSGADAIKFQYFRADTMVARDHPDYDIFKRYEVPDIMVQTLAEMSANFRFPVFYSVFDPADVAKLDPFVPAFKIASAELTYRSLLKAVAATGKPVILSTGMSTLMEYLEAVQHFKPELVYPLHCVSAYPAPPVEMNLAVMRHWSWGLSDHTAEPFGAPLMAAAMGACIVEKHFCMTREGPSPDAPFSIIPSELKQLATALHSAHLMLGDGNKRVMPSEQAALSDRRVLIDGRWLRGYPK